MNMQIFSSSLFNTTNINTLTLTQLPFNTVHIQDEIGGVDNIIVKDVIELNRADDYINDRYDQSLLNDIDPDINFINAIKNAKSLYYCDKQFNGKFKGNCNLSLLHSNIRSIARNFSDMNIYLEHLEHTFQIIGITESWLKPNNVIDYTPKGYSHEYNIRLSRNGGRTQNSECLFRYKCKAIIIFVTNK